MKIFLVKETVSKIDSLSPDVEVNYFKSIESAREHLKKVKSERVKEEKKIVKEFSDILEYSFYNDKGVPCFGYLYITDVNVMD